MNHFTTAATRTRCIPSNLLQQWQNHLQQLADPSVEMLVENIAPMVSVFNRLHKAGHHFDPAVVILMRKLQQQLADYRLQDTGDEREIDDTEERGGTGAYADSLANRFLTLSRRYPAVLAKIPQGRKVGA